VASEPERLQATPSLICAECGAESTADAAGWRGYLTDDDEAVTFCPECASREFGAYVLTRYRSRVGFDRDDRVRLTREEGGVPAESEGVVAGRREATNTIAVQFFTHGWHEVPEDSLEAVDEPS
jgi:hypothetical protein